ncbi:MAG TPA: hypothetical protein VL117_04515 [Thermoleophilia bacterium]|nr:hypothetical protein [Thermoleophilia bacterium]
MSDFELPYRLPQSCVRIAGTRTFVHDAVLGRDDTSAQATVALDVIAGHEPAELRIAEGLLDDTNVTFEWTDDGRLVTSAVALTGRAGTVAAGALSAGASLAGVLLGSPAMALSCAGAEAATAHRLASSNDGARAVAPGPAPATAVGAAAGPRPVAADPASAEREAVGAAYRAAHPHEGAALDACAALVPELVAGLTDALRAVPVAGADKERTEALAAVHALESSIAAARSQAGALDEHFRAWRATTLVTRLEHYEFLLELDTLVAARTSPVLENGRLRSAGAGSDEQAAALAAVQAAFEALGVVVVVDDEPGFSGPTAPAAPAAPAPSPPGQNELLVRLPRRVRLTAYELDGGVLVQRSSNPALVMDRRCPRVTVRLAKTLFGKRTLKLGFSAGSALQSLHVAATSEAAGLAEAADALPNAVALGLDRSRRIVGRVAALRGAELDQRLAVLTRQLQLKRQEIAQAGLLATEGSYGELAALKRQVELLQQRKELLALEADLGVAAPTAAATDAATAPDPAI